MIILSRTVLTNQLTLILAETEVSYEIRVKEEDKGEVVLFTESNRNSAAAMYHDFIEMFRALRSN